MFFKLGLLLGAALTIGLITLALIATSGDNPASDGDTVDPVAVDLNGSELPPGSDNQKAGNGPGEGQGSAANTLEAFLVIWSQQQDQTLSISLQVGSEDLTDCRFSLDREGAMQQTSAKVLASGSQQRGCIGHFGDIAEISPPASLTVQGAGGAETITCQFDLQATVPAAAGHDLFWSTNSPGCVGNPAQ